MIDLMFGTKTAKKVLDGVSTSELTEGEYLIREIMALQKQKIIADAERSYSEVVELMKYPSTKKLLSDIAMIISSHFKENPHGTLESGDSIIIDIFRTIVYVATYSDLCYKCGDAGHCSELCGLRIRIPKCTEIDWTCPQCQEHYVVFADACKHEETC